MSPPSSYTAHYISGPFCENDETYDATLAEAMSAACEKPTVKTVKTYRYQELILEVDLDSDAKTVFRSIEISPSFFRCEMVPCNQFPSSWIVDDPCVTVRLFIPMTPEESLVFVEDFRNQIRVRRMYICGPFTKDAPTLNLDDE